MNISSAVVRARPDRASSVREVIAGIPGVEIHAGAGDGRLVVTIEDGEGYSTADAFMRLHQIDGVINVSLVYQYCDDGTEEEAKS
jgi:nitrate reductase NapD